MQTHMLQTKQQTSYGKSLFITLCLLCACSGMQTGVRVTVGSQSVTLQPWLVGLTAVVGFLFIVFIVLIDIKENPELQSSLISPQILEEQSILTQP
uniref:Uncharacterized protein n=1 Tax=Sphaeramia orbicularis TaxID=375764 RepID=A0A673CSW4_9TELE